ncbi:MAG TPA: FHA domain-containing protein [Thermoanaerobaculia bacterium]|nr:FHA domain-containing protein [Thermoanaerobaculia bacterium]
MQVVLQGNLTKFPLSQLLTLLSEHSHSGTLDIESGASRARVFIDGGKVIFAESSDGTAGNAGEAVVRTFEWPDAQFTFLDGMSLPDKATRVTLDVESIVAEAAKRAEGGYADYAMFRVIDNPAAQEKITIAPEEFTLLFKIGMGKTFGDLVSEPGATRRATGAKLKILEKAGLVLRVDQAAPSMIPGASQNTAETPRPKGREERRPRAQAPAEGVEKTVFAPKVDMADATQFTPPPPPPRQPTDEIPAPLATEKTQAGEVPVPPVASAPPPPILGDPKNLFGSLTPDSGDTWPLVDNEYTIGRDDTNSIPVPDGSISSKHARLLRNEQGFWVEDLGSRNGTFVNGEKVTDKRLLSNGDLVRFGKVIMTFHMAQDSSSDQTVVESK